MEGGIKEKYKDWYASCVFFKKDWYVFLLCSSLGEVTRELGQQICRWSSPPAFFTVVVLLFREYEIDSVHQSIKGTFHSYRHMACAVQCTCYAAQGIHTLQCAEVTAVQCSGHILTTAPALQCSTQTSAVTTTQCLAVLVMCAASVSQGNSVCTMQHSTAPSKPTVQHAGGHHYTVPTRVVYSQIKQI